jgi:lactoylglutathione lyase
MTTSTTPSQAGGVAAGLNPFKPRISHVAYYVADIERSLAFYLGVLGMVEQMRLDLGKGVHEVVLGFPESKGGGLILMWDTARKAPFQRGDAYLRVVLNVSDVDAAVEHVEKHGAGVPTRPTDAGSLRYAMIEDPDGYIVELLRVKRA